MNARRVALGALAIAVLVAGGVLVAFVLWPTTVPSGLRLSALAPNRYFTAAALRRGRDFKTTAALLTLASQLAAIIALAFYARFGERLERESAAGRVGTGIMLALLGFAIAAMAALPFELALLWWMRHHHLAYAGYATLVLGDWTSLGGRAIFVAAAVAIVMGLAGPLRRTWWVAAPPAFAALALLQVFVGPYLLPDTQPLHDARLAAQVRSLARADGLGGGVKVQVENVHRETPAPNAEATGIGPSRTVVLWDTLLRGQRFTEAELRTVLAHELGHLQRNHLLKKISWFTLFSLVIAAAVAAATRRRGGMYAARAVPLALFIYVALQFIASPLANVISRRYEREADWIALRSARDPATQRSMLTKLTLIVSDDPNPPTWEYVMLADHPTAVQRLALANAWQQRNHSAAAR